MKNRIFTFLLFISMSMHSQQVVVTATCYNAVVEQCNEDVQHTASMFKLDLEDPYSHRIIAISRDLEEKGFKMGDKVVISGTNKYDGEWIIQDRMNRRWENKIDLLVNLDMKVGKWLNVIITKK